MKPSPGLSSGVSRDTISLDCCGDWATLRSRQPRKYVTEYMKRPTKYLSLVGSQWPSCGQPSDSISGTFPNFGHEFDSRYPLIQILLGRQCDLPTLGNSWC